MTGGCTVEVRLKPRAKADRVTVRDSGHLDIAVQSPPVENAANVHLIELLSDRIRIPKSSISVIRGGHSKMKVVRIEGLTIEEVMNRINEAVLR